MGVLFTIGHSQHTQEDFIALLKLHKINYVLDVRSIPYSKYAEQFNKEQIEALLKQSGIRYSFMGKCFGARQTNPFLFSEEGYLDFEKVAQSENFIKGMKSVILGLEQGNCITMMCTEKDPIDCHRAIMVARAFDKHGIEVHHILPNGSIQTQKELDNRLIDRYFPDRAQMSIFEYQNNISEAQYVAQAYHERNKEIGFEVG